MWALLFILATKASVTCDWVEAEPPMVCEENQTCCPHNGDVGDWGCCPTDTFCHVSEGGNGECCTGDITNCSPVSIDMKEEELSYSGADLGLAFGLTSGAGACTGLGVAVVYFVEDIQKTGILGYSLAFAAGVMIYISFVEILAEAVEQFEHRFKSAAIARLMSAISFFAGIAFGYAIDMFVHWLGERQRAKEVEIDFNEPGVELSDFKEDGIDDDVEVQFSHGELNLTQITLVTALAVAAHNLPEGLVTFVSTLYSPTTGMAIAVAIAIHNIPEGIAIAVPVYYQTKSIMKAFFWALISGIAEPLGALIGYAILDSMFGAEVFGWMFGSVGGIMVYISFGELLPVAFKTNAAYKTVAVFVGMLVMELSLILFEI